MAKLEILTQFKQSFIKVNQSLNNYNNNLRNELFEAEPNESNDKAYRRGETIFDQCEKDIENLTEIIYQQEDINKFFEKCKENKIKLIAKKNEIIAEIIEKCGLPAIVKPVNLGSSIGISKAASEKELETAISLAVSFSDKILAEKAIENLREINCSVLGDSDSAEASVCEEPFMHDKILSYEDKYMGNSGSKGMASLGRQLPANIPNEVSNKIRKLSTDIFKAIGASGVVRIDYLLNDKTGEIYANEINTIPGSLSFYLWEATGLKYTDMIDKLVSLAFKRQRNRDNLTFTIKTNILSGVSFGSKGSKGSKF